MLPIPEKPQNTISLPTTNTTNYLLDNPPPNLSLISLALPGCCTPNPALPGSLLPP